MRPLHGQSTRIPASGTITAADGAPSRDISGSVPFRSRPRRPLISRRGNPISTCLPGTVTTPSSSFGRVSGRAAVPRRGRVFQLVGKGTDQLVSLGAENVQNFLCPLISLRMRSIALRLDLYNDRR